MTDLAGKHGLIVGVANRRSISWAIARAAAAAGARIALTYPSERLEENVRELAATLDNPVVTACDVTSDQHMADLAAALDREFTASIFLFTVRHLRSRPSSRTRSCRRPVKGSGLRST